MRRTLTRSGRVVATILLVMIVGLAAVVLCPI